MLPRQRRALRHREVRRVVVKRVVVVAPLRVRHVPRVDLLPHLLRRRDAIRAPLLDRLRRDLLRRLLRSLDVGAHRVRRDSIPVPVEPRVPGVERVRRRGHVRHPGSGVARGRGRRRRRRDGERRRRRRRRGRRRRGRARGLDRGIVREFRILRRRTGPQAVDVRAAVHHPRHRLRERLA
eukprot:26219-Pelagococcus_subviridis.AAC.3